MTLNKLSEQLSVRPQVQLDELPGLVASGFRGIINNRPDGEAPDQPTSAQLEAEARRQGLQYWHIPIVPGKATETDARAFSKALEEADGPVVAFCRTGNRSTGLFKMSQQAS